MAIALEELTQRLARLASAGVSEKLDVVYDDTQRAAGEPRKWMPNPGPQTDAYFCAADILLYGGQGGGGKSDLGLGLAFTAHRRSLILRRKYTNLSGLVDRAKEINGGSDGFNGTPPPKLLTRDGRLVMFGANQRLGDEQDFQGIPFDLKVFDEAAQFLEAQIRFHLGWLRSTELTPTPSLPLSGGGGDRLRGYNADCNSGGALPPPSPSKTGVNALLRGRVGVGVRVRTRAVLATNPPMDSTGDWLIGFFRPWLDITHSKPAKPGELRWFVTAPDGSDLEVADQTLVELGGRTLTPMSRTFIPAELADNPFLVNTGYQAVLDGLPEPLRSAVRDGNFMAARKDAEWQVIPTAWVLEAQARWTPRGFGPFGMTAMAFDPAGGGKDAAELAWRHQGWYAPVVTAKGAETADGSRAAGTIIAHRRDSAAVVVDVGGGYGGAVTLRLSDNGIAHRAFNGAGKSTAKTVDGRLGFVNKRAEAWWRFREALDPDQKGGSVIALPDDPELRADLTAPTYDVTDRGIRIEGKDDIRARLGRSPGKGDAVVMCLSEGTAAVMKAMQRDGGGHGLQSMSVRGYQGLKARRR